MCWGHISLSQGHEGDMMVIAGVVQSAGTQTVAFQSS